MIRPCPNCGSDQMVVKAQARGPVELHFNQYGSETLVADERVRYESSNIVRCAMCGQIRDGLRVIHNEIKFPGSPVVRAPARLQKTHATR